VDKKVIFAVAGSGKTTMILNSLDDEKRVLIITYTLNNLKNIRDGVLRKWGYFPDHIHVQSYFTFIYSFCFRPFLSKQMGVRGINWKPNLNKFAQGNDRYIDSYQRLYSNRIPKLMEQKDILNDVNVRLEKYFDAVYIDEVQDLAGHDFNFLKTIAKANLSLLFVGDFFQHTYDTSRDGSTNRTLHDDLNKYIAQFKAMGLEPDTDSLIKSHRCNPEICKFITEQLGIHVESHRDGGSAIKIINEENEVRIVFQDNAIIKLFYQAHYHYDCYSRNWGESKGEDKYHDVCVVINPTTWQAFKAGKLTTLAPQTKNKLYVACSRTKGNLYFIEEARLKSFKTK
jgi:DNA helicase-2/ATP-dependent DNA helicase PcrA